MLSGSVTMPAAAVMIRTLSGYILDALYAAGGIEHKLRKATVQILAAQTKKIRVLEIVDGKLSAKDLPGRFIADFNGDFVRS